VGLSDVVTQRADVPSIVKCAWQQTASLCRKLISTVRCPMPRKHLQRLDELAKQLEAIRNALDVERRRIARAFEQMDNAPFATPVRVGPKGDRPAKLRTPKRGTA
jgi:hypothetical protein